MPVVAAIAAVAALAATTVVMASLEPLHDILLVVNFNQPFYYQIPLLKHLYRDVFPNMVFYGDVHADADHPEVTLLNTTMGHLQTVVLLHAIEQHGARYMGVVFTNDDVLLNVWLLRSLNTSKAWYVHHRHQAVDVFHPPLPFGMPLLHRTFAPHKLRGAKTRRDAARLHAAAQRIGALSEHPPADAVHEAADAPPPNRWNENWGGDFGLAACRCAWHDMHKHAPQHLARRWEKTLWLNSPLGFVVDYHPPLYQARSSSSSSSSSGDDDDDSSGDVGDHRAGHEHAAAAQRRALRRQLRRQPPMAGTAGLPHIVGGGDARRGGSEPPVFFHHGPSDFVYLPSRFFDEFVVLARSFTRCQVHFEIAVPTIVSCLAQDNDDVMLLCGTYLWGPQRERWQEHLDDKKTAFIHPVKLGHHSNQDLILRWNNENKLHFGQ